MTKDTRKRPIDFFNKNGNLLGNIFQKVAYLSKLNDIVSSTLEPPLSEHCRVINLEQGHLILASDSAHWLTLLRFTIPALLETLRNTHQLHHIASISCKIIPAYTKISEKKTSSPALPSTQSAHLIRQIAEEMDHERLKIALKKLAGRSKK